MMATIQTKRQLFKSKQNARVKNTIPQEKDVIKNTYGNDPEIPETIYNRIQHNIKKGNNTNAILKIKLNDGSSLWTKNRFEPSINNKFKNHFTVKTEILDKKEVTRAEKLYHILKKIEQKVSILQANKFLDGYLEEHCISFNELATF